MLAVETVPSPVGLGKGVETALESEEVAVPSAVVPALSTLELPEGVIFPGVTPVMVVWTGVDALVLPEGVVFPGVPPVAVVTTGVDTLELPEGVIFPEVTPVVVSTGVDTLGMEVLSVGPVPGGVWDAVGVAPEIVVPGDRLETAVDGVTSVVSLPVVDVLGGTVGPEWESTLLCPI